MAFTTLAKLKERMGIPAADTSQDAKLTSIITAVENEILAYFNLDSDLPTSYTNTYDVPDSSTPGIWLVQYPVITVDEVQYFGEVQPAAEYYLQRPVKFGSLAPKQASASGGKLLYFPHGVQAVQVTHTAGFADPSRDREMMCQLATLMAILDYNTSPKVGYDSERIGQYSYRLGFGGGGGAGSGAAGSGQGVLPAPAERIMAHFRRPFASE